jgi:hypothetical protein
MGLSFVANAAITGEQADGDGAFGCVGISTVVEKTPSAPTGAFSHEISGMTVSTAFVPRSTDCPALVVQFDENVVYRL